MLNILLKAKMSQIKAFTLLESLLTLVVTAFLLLVFSGPISASFRKVEEQLFFLSFEHLYQDSQKLAISKHEPQHLILQKEKISNGQTSLVLPASIDLEKPLTVTFDQAGGNSSLAKISFQTADRKVTYQLYLGSGQYQKKEH